MTTFALLIALALACGGAGALKCFQCNSVENPNCEEGPDAKYLSECPAPPTGQVARCVKLDGAVTQSGVTEGGIDRACFNYPKSKSVENKCYMDNDALNLIKELAGTSIIPIDGSVSFKGNLCFCNTDQCNSVASVQPFLGLLVAAVGLCVIGVWR